MRVARVVLVLAILACLVPACGGSPAQIVDYSPLRGSQGVPTVAPVGITFDHAVDQASVASRLHLSPGVQGTVRWISDRQLEYDHPILQTSTSYEVVLEAGYRDSAGDVYVLRHHWSFTTEPPPSFAASSPADGATRIDPADYLSVDFTRPMNQESLRSAIAFDPQVAFSVRLDPTDDRRAIVAPTSLLDPNTTYTLLVGIGALDVDGNQLDRVRSVRFVTGDASTLHHWITFATLSASGSSGGLWIVNESGFPRRLLDAGSVQSFAWSPDGTRLVYQAGSGGWSTFAPGHQPVALDFTATWAAALAQGSGYAYLDSAGALYRETNDRTTTVVGTGVGGAAVSPDGLRVAYTQPQGDGTTMIWGYDIGLRSHYVLGVEKGEVSALSWAPSGNRLAYLRVDAASMTLRVLALAGTASTTTVATGDMDAPVWLHDSAHIVVDALVQSASGPIHKAFLINVAAPASSLTLALGLPSDPGVDVTDPVPSPDGHQIAFVSGNKVWLMNADGTRPTPLTRYDADAFPYSCLMPAWTRS
jgi:Tol biopolymer transport system component